MADHTRVDTENQRRHARAVANSLHTADGCAARGELEDALGWLEMVRAIGDQLPADYEAKRVEWLHACHRRPDVTTAAPNRAAPN
jgi:hypothetical protein